MDVLVDMELNTVLVIIRLIKDLCLQVITFAMAKKVVIMLITISYCIKEVL